MRILLDESLPHRLKVHFKEHHVQTVPEAGWQGRKNGELLSLMEGKFDVFITSDQNLQYQLNLRNTKVSVIILAAPTNRYENLKNLVPKLLTYLQSSQLENTKRIA